MWNQLSVKVPKTGAHLPAHRPENARHRVVDIRRAQSAAPAQLAGLTGWGQDVALGSRQYRHGWYAKITALLAACAVYDGLSDRKLNLQDG
jgi:hypothetical protein